VAPSTRHLARVPLFVPAGCARCAERVEIPRIWNRSSPPHGRPIRRSVPNGVQFGGLWAAPRISQRI